MKDSARFKFRAFTDRAKLWQREHYIEINTFTGKTRRKWCPRGKTCRVNKIQRVVIALFQDKRRLFSMEIPLSRAAAEVLFTPDSQKLCGFQNKSLQATQGPVILKQEQRKT